MNRSKTWIPAVVCFSLVLCSCQQPPIEVAPSPTTVQTNVPEPTPTSQEIEEIEEPGDSRFAVTGLLPGQNLALYTEPELNAPQIGLIPSYTISLVPFGEPIEEEGQSWIRVQYQDLRGWVDRGYLAEQTGSIPEPVIQLGQQVLAALKDYNYDLVTDLIHPEQCLRISPYPYLNIDNRIICSQDLLSQSLVTDQVLWGQYDGTGDPILLSFQEYHTRFIYDLDYIAAPVVGFDQEVSSGNSINNIPEIFPDGMMVEYHFPGFDPQYGGLDWRSLRLVFLQIEGNWYLAAIIHGEWTI